MKKLLAIIGIIILGACLNGCVRKVVYDRPPVPPLPQEDIVIAYPYKDKVWVPSHWVWKGKARGYEMEKGHWQKLPKSK